MACLRSPSSRVECPYVVICPTHFSKCKRPPSKNANTVSSRSEVVPSATAQSILQLHSFEKQTAG